jgi:hypothetical protein
MVKQPCSCSYKYGGVKVQPQEFAPWMCEILMAIMPLCGIAKPDWPNSANLNYYAEGQQAVGWHADDEKLFQGACADTTIISLSLGSTRNFEIMAKVAHSNGQFASKTIALHDGDLLTMEGMCQKHFSHRITRDESKHARINITFRWVIKHDQKCRANGKNQYTSLEIRVYHSRRLRWVSLTGSTLRGRSVTVSLSICMT